MVRTANSATIATMKPQRLRLKPRLFRRLQWHLTLSFMKVTFGTTVTALGLILALIGAFISLSPELPNALVRAVKSMVPKVQPLLSEDTPNTKALQKCLEQSDLAINEFRSFRINFDGENNEITEAIFSSRGELLAHRPENSPLRLEPVEQELIDQALGGETKPGRLGKRLPSAVFVAAVPVKDEDGDVIGVLFCRTPPAFRIADAIIAFLVGILPVGLIVALSSGMVAGISGYLSARRLTRRLEEIARAADSWGRGDFSILAPEAGDEMGLLSARLNRMAAELQEMLALKSDIATLEERNRLARDLHDTVKQQVFASAMQVAAARALLPQQPDAAKARLDIASELAEQAQRELTAVLHELRPVSAESAPLATLLKGQVADWGRRTGVRVEFYADASLGSLSPESANALLRIAQEALANADKHSGATRVEVSIKSAEAHTVRLMVRDNGRGFDKRAQSGGFGMHSMRERAEALPGGRFQILSAPGAGCAIIAVCGA
jgi:two-component system, NarL family, sensor histidine kinase LiaS